MSTIEQVKAALAAQRLPEGVEVVEMARQWLITIPMGKEQDSVLQGKVEAAGIGQVTGAAIEFGEARADGTRPVVYLIGVSKDE